MEITLVSHVTGLVVEFEREIQLTFDDRESRVVEANFNPVLEPKIYKIYHISSMFTTERLILRGFEDYDLERLLALRNNVAVQRGKTFGPVVPRPSKYKEFLRSLAEESALSFIIIEEKSREFVGHCTVRIEEFKNRDGEFSISLFPRFWGKGYGTEAATFTVGYAFSALGLQRMSLSVLEGNAAARRLYEKIGFRDEGRKRRGNWAEGHWEDIIYMGILEEEWAALNKVAQK